MRANGTDSKPRPAQRTSDEREARREEGLEVWAVENSLRLDRLDVGPQWVVFAAIELVSFLSAVPALARVVGYFLSHCGLDLERRSASRASKVDHLCGRSTAASKP